MVLLRLFNSNSALQRGDPFVTRFSRDIRGGGGAAPQILPRGGRKEPREGRGGERGSRGAPRAMRSLTDVVIHPQRPPETDAGRDGFIHQLLHALQRGDRTPLLARTGRGPAPPPASPHTARAPTCTPTARSISRFSRSRGPMCRREKSSCRGRSRSMHRAASPPPQRRWPPAAATGRRCRGAPRAVSRPHQRPQLCIAPPPLPPPPPGIHCLCAGGGAARPPTAGANGARGRCRPRPASPPPARPPPRATPLGPDPSLPGPASEHPCGGAPRPRGRAAGGKTRFSVFLQQSEDLLSSYQLLEE